MASASKRRGRIFYGWWIAISAATFNFFTGGTFFYGFTAFFRPMVSEFQWGYGATALASSLRSVEMGAFAPFIGFLVDRLGPRKLLLAGTVVTSGGFILWSRVNSLGMFYAAFLVIALGLSACSATTMMTAVANWFRRKVSIAMGVMMAGFGVAGLMIPLIVWLIERNGWRTTALMAGIGILLIGVPVSLVMRRRPEDYGLLPDGEAPGPPAASAEELRESHGVEPLPPVVAEESFSAREALRTRAFWMISLAIALQAVVLTSVITHVMPYLESLAMPRHTAGWVASFLGIMSIVGRLGFGWLGDRFDKRYVMASAFSMQVVGMLLFAHLSTYWLIIPFLLLYGPGYGGTIPLRAAIQRDYFGRQHFGAVQGLITGMLTAGGIVGPPVAGWVFDARGSYYAVWVAFIFVTVLSVPMILLARRPVKPARQLVAASPEQRAEHTSQLPPG